MDVKALKFGLTAKGDLKEVVQGTSPEPFNKELRSIKSSDFPKGVVEFQVWALGKGRVKRVRLENVKLNEANKAKQAKKKAAK